MLFDPPLDASLVVNEASELDSLIGAADELTANAITQALLAEGLDLTGMEFFVFALPSGKGNMLVLDFETALETMVTDSNAANTAPDLEEIMQHLVTSMAYADAGVERFVLNLRYLGTENDAELLVTMTLPNSTLVDWVTGAITQEAALGEMDIEVSQVMPQ